VKHSTPDSMKFKKLQRLLGCSKRETAGVLELLWIATQNNAKRGDIGKFENLEIAIECDWDGDPDEFVESLVVCGWLDRCSTHRLVVHDWSQHAPRYIHAWIKSQNTTFATPEKAIATDAKVVATVGTTTEATTGGTKEGGIRNQTKPNETKPNQTKDICGTNAANAYTEDFENLFWKKYPKNGNGRKRGKETCFKLWKKVPGDERQDLSSATDHYRQESESNGGQFVKDPERFLKNGFWRDYVEEKEQPRELTHEEKVAEMMRDSGLLGAAK